MGGWTDADLWGVAWAMFAATAGLVLAVAAIAFFHKPETPEDDEASAGYNMLAPFLDR